MNVNDAAYATVHDYPGGAESLAPRLGPVDDEGRKRPMSPAVLNSKVNPNTNTHHLTLAEAQRIMMLTGDCRILEAQAQELHKVCIDVPDFEGVADLELLDGYMALVADEGKFATDFREALADGKIERREFEKLRDDVHAQQAHQMELLARIESLVVEE